MLRRSSISCWRSGDLSIERLNSRRLHGAGLRSATRPSLSMRTRWNPRGRSFCRTSERSEGEVSVMMMTSRSARSSGCSANSSIWWRNCGSFGLSAKTTTGRAIQTNVPRSISAASKTCVRSASHRSDTVSCAAAAKGATARYINEMVRSAALIMPMNIGILAAKSKSDLVPNTNIFFVLTQRFERTDRTNRFAHDLRVASNNINTELTEVCGAGATSRFAAPVTGGRLYGKH